VDEEVGGDHHRIPTSAVHQFENEHRLSHPPTWSKSTVPAVDEGRGQMLSRNWPLAGPKF